MRADRRRASPLVLLLLSGSAFPGCGADEVPASPADASPRASLDGGGGGGAQLGCHDPSTPLPVSPTDGCADDPVFVDPRLSDEETGAPSESFAFFFARRCGRRARLRGHGAARPGFMRSLADVRDLLRRLRRLREPQLLGRVPEARVHQRPIGVRSPPMGGRALSESRAGVQRVPVRDERGG